MRKRQELCGRECLHTMASVFGDYSRLFRFFHVADLVGTNVFSISSFASVVKRFVFGDDALVPDVEDVGRKRKREHSETDSPFVAEALSLFHLFPDLKDTSGEVFQKFSAFTVNCGNPMGSVLCSRRKYCRICRKALSVDPKSHVIVIYHEQRGTYLGSRLTKYCHGCKVYEHYGYWTKNGARQFDESFQENQFLLSSEDTAFDLSLIRQCASLLVVGAVPFSTFARSYNRKFGYGRDCEEPNSAVEEKPVKRMKRTTPVELKQLLKDRQSLDRRRLEEAFLLFASLEVLKKFGLAMKDIPCNRNVLAEAISGQFYEAFLNKWGDHRCATPGCNSVLVLDGNMKNARQVCACRDVGELRFAKMEGTVVVGCQNTPAKGSRYCTTHNGIAREFVDDNESDGKVLNNSSDSQDLLIVKIVNEKTTRQGKLYEVLWSDGRKSWVKQSNLPKKMDEILKTGKVYHQRLLDVAEFGQQRRELQLESDEVNNNGHVNEGEVVKSSGFAMEGIDDSLVPDVNGIKRKLACGTEKGRHKCKNFRTAGILVMERPCGIVINVKELFGSESKSQVYAHIHNLLEKASFNTTSTICYDDACHLKRFSQNPARSAKTPVAVKLRNMEMLCDKFHFRNHTDTWCRKNCNPLTSESLKGVNTEVCEQLFSWLSKFSHITKHMNRWRFLFLMLYALDCHNEDVISENKK